MQILNGLEFEDVTLECHLHGIRLSVAQIGVVKLLFVKRSGNMAAHKVAAFTALHGIILFGTFLARFLV